MPKFTYVLSAYAPEAYGFSIPLRASEAWLKKVLRRKDIINAEPLKRPQFDAVKKRVDSMIELCWYDQLSYFVEADHGSRSSHRLTNKDSIDRSRRAEDVEFAPAERQSIRC